MPQGPLFESPLDVIQRVKAQREEMYGSGNAASIFQAQIGSLVDSLVGNPEVRRVKDINDKIYKRMGTPTGNEMEQEIQKLRAARDVYAEAGDLNRASQFNQQLLQLQVADMEQRKLKAETVHSENAEARAAETHPLDVANKIGEANEYINWGNPNTGKMQSVHEADVALSQQLAEQGWINMGKAQLQGTKDELFGLTKPVITDLQTALGGAREQRDNLRTAASLYKPEFSTVLTQAGLWTADKVDRLAPSVVPENMKETLAQYTQWKSQTLDNLNRYVKYITGAQMSQFEIKRITDAMPNEDNGPTKYIANTRRAARMALQAEKRAQIALRTGNADITGEEIAARYGNLDDFNVSEAEIDALLGPGFSNPAKPGKKDMSKMTPAQKIQCIKDGTC